MLKITLINHYLNLVEHVLVVVKRLDIKLLPNYLEKRMLVANATGCSSIYGGSFPTSPYTTLPNGSGQQANSLFEDNANLDWNEELVMKQPEIGFKYNGNS